MLFRSEQAARRDLEAQAGGAGVHRPHLHHFRAARPQALDHRAHQRRRDLDRGLLVRLQELPGRDQTPTTTLSASLAQECSNEWERLVSVTFIDG